MQNAIVVTLIQSSCRCLGAAILPLSCGWSTAAVAATQEGFPDPRFGAKGRVKVAASGGDGANMFVLDLWHERHGRFG
ncbi:hypothetical protein C7S18_07010 [Ahniella affigens]|uniref:Uncharacterized protein n=1 Tax=Ahniella affigens TaxID=2021234 RepID=A0A2P1PQ37_9GAMM|nr:hypothetical protein C7S18_07010 [Ahniella affigens]